jgi:hypothetical protein
MTAQDNRQAMPTCNEFMREYQREFGAEMTYAGKGCVTFRGEPWQTVTDNWHDDLSPFYRAVYGLPENGTERGVSWERVESDE